MKMFQTVKQHMAMMGFVPHQQQNTGRLLSFRQILCIMQFSLQMIGSTMVLLDGTDTPEDYVQMIFALTAVIGVTISFLSISFNNDKLFFAIELSEEEAEFS